MGYTTNFSGEIRLNKPLDNKLADYIRKFSETRRMKLDTNKLSNRADPLREAAGLPIGIEGEYCVAVDDNWTSSEPDKAVINYNQHPSTQPGLWCDWTIGEDNQCIVWNGGEKFYEYNDWMKYVIRNFIVPFGYEANGEIEWQGEDDADFGILGVADNEVYVRHGVKDYSEREYI